MNQQMILCCSLLKGEHMQIAVEHMKGHSPQMVFSYADSL